MAEASGLPPDSVALLRMGAFVVLFGGLATQFMICNYINMLARRLLRAVHALSSSIRPMARRED